MLRCFGLAIVACVAFLSTFAAGETNCALCRGVVDIAERILVLNTTTNGGKFEDIVRQPPAPSRAASAFAAAFSTREVLLFARSCVCGEIISGTSSRRSVPRSTNRGSRRFF